MNEKNFTLLGKDSAVVSATPVQLFFITVELRKIFSARLLVLFVSCFLSGSLFAEGTKQLQPTNLVTNKAPLYISASSDSGGNRTNFAGWGETDDKSRLYVNIQDPTTESLYIGLGDWIGLGAGNAIRYRVIAPDGTTIVKEMTMTTANILNYTEAVTGPNALVAGGYNVATGGGPHVVSPTEFIAGGSQIGDYFIEFSEVDAITDVMMDDFDGFSIGLYDFTVGAGTAIDGRVWSFRWEFRQEGPEGVLDYEFDGAFYVCAEDNGTTAISNDGFVTRIDFLSDPGLLPLNGFLPGNFNLIFNDEGPGVGATSLEKRKSRVGCTQLGTPEHKAYLNDPVDVCMTANFGIPFSSARLEQCGPDSYCWVVSVDKFGGDFEIVLDLDGNAGYDMNSADVLLSHEVLAGEENTNVCIPWDGLDGNGNLVGLTINLANVNANYLEGVFHFPVFDAEANTDGFEVSYVRPIPSSPLQIKWDDSVVNGGACDQSCGTALGACPKDIGAGCVDFELDGCDPTMAGCSRCWQNAYGDRATLNTFWNIFIENLTPTVEPVSFYECSIDGNTILCNAGETTTLSANIVTTGTPGPFSWEWEDPDGMMTSGTGTMSSDIPDFIGLDDTDLGTYTLTLSFGLACTSTCSATLTQGTTPDLPVITGGDLDRDLCTTPADPTLIELTLPASVLLYEETFEEDGAGAVAPCEDETEIVTCVNYTPPTNGQWTLTGTDYGLGTGSSAIDYLQVINGQLEAMDIDGTLCFETTVIDISSNAVATFSLDISEDSNSESEPDDIVEINYSLDGGAFVNALTLSDDFAAQTVTESDLVGNTLQLQVCFTNDANHEHYFLDNVRVTNSSTYNYYNTDPTAGGATPIATGTSYDPTIPANTTSTIWVTCFNGQCESDAVALMFDNSCCDLAVTCAATVPNTNLQCATDLPTAPTSFNDFAEKGDEVDFEALHPTPDFLIDDGFCGEIVITSLDTDNGGAGCAASPLIITRTYTILDDEDGNGTQNGTEVTATCSETFTFIDNFDPTFALCDDNNPSNDTIALGCNPTAPTAADAIAAAGAIIDACGVGTNMAMATMTASITEGCLTTEEWTVTINDVCNNSGSCIINYQYLTDTDAPTFALCSDGITANDTIALGCNPTAPTAADAITAAGTITEVCGLGANTASATQTNIQTLNCLTVEEWTVTVTDSCGNIGNCIVSYSYTTDHIAPVLPCQTNTTLALSGDGSEVDWSVIISSASITDACGVTSVQVRREDMLHCPDDDSSEFGATVPFFCCDVGNTVTVEVQATDACGNMNSCNVFVMVEDNIVPMITCPADESIDCDSLHLLSTYNGVTLDDDGQVDVPAPAGVLTYVINLDDPANPDTTFLGYFDSALIWEDCGGATIYTWDSGSVNDCGSSVDASGNLLPIQRHFLAVDAVGNVSATCIQQITVSNLTPFDPTTIVWPAHHMSPGSSCGASIHPDALPVGSQRPMITASDNCENLAVGYSDSPNLYPTNPTSNYCYKILRTWEVLNWCTNETYSQVQVIMVVDPGPVFTSTCPDMVTLIVGNNLTLTKEATDVCSGTSASISYTVDLNNDGSIDNNGTTGVIYEVTGGTAFPAGIHKITFTAVGCSASTTCEVMVTINSPNPPGGMANISGLISNEFNGMIENVMISPAIGMDVTMTDVNGAFDLNLPSSGNYELTPQKDEDHLNGVSTYDIVLLSQHILQTGLLDSPYKIIAGDVNKSGSITTLDLVELRKAILFINDEFTNNSSWRFVDADYVFPSATNPFEEVFPETYAINGLVGDMVDLDFVAVKIGDINGNANTSDYAEDTDERDFEGTLKLEIEEGDLETEETQVIDIKAKDFNNLLGYQFTMLFEHLEILDIIPGELTALTDANFGTQFLDKGILTSSWNNNEAVSLDDGAVLFSLKFKAEAYVDLKSAMKLTSDYTTAEAYVDKFGEIALLDVDFAFVKNNKATSPSVFELYQNRPNPFKDETVIGFDLPNGGAATLTVYDLSGRILTQIKDDYAKGYNEINIHRSDLPATGVVYYELSTGKNTALRKMTIVE